MDKKPERREIDRHHHWKLGQDPNDPDTDNPNVEFHELGRLIESDQQKAQEAEAALARWENHGGPESGMPCTDCGQMTRIVDEKKPIEILGAAGLVDASGVRFSDHVQESIYALACPGCDNVMQMRASAMPKRN